MRIAAGVSGARGIGLAVARRLLREGVRVAIADIDAAALAIAMEDLRRIAPDAAISCRCDVSDAGSVQAFKALVLEQFGGLDILVNNAAILDWTSLETLAVTRLEEVWRGRTMSRVLSFFCARMMQGMSWGRPWWWTAGSPRGFEVSLRVHHSLG